MSCEYDEYNKREISLLFNNGLVCRPSAELSIKAAGCEGVGAVCIRPAGNTMQAATAEALTAQYEYCYQLIFHKYIKKL